MNFWERITIAQEKTQRINDEITAPEVRLVGAEGEQLGIVNIRAALQMAEEAELDLVEIAPLAKPPVYLLGAAGAQWHRAISMMPDLTISAASESGLSSSLSCGGARQAMP